MPDDPLKTAQEGLVSSLWPLLCPPADGYRCGKVIHDPIWGSCRFESWEVTLIDMPLFQRLRGLKQTGFAYQTYPAAEHSRFHHTLGVITAAGRTLESLRDRFEQDAFSSRAKSEKGSFDCFKDKDDFRKTLCMVRLAALVHDLCHSLFSHTSERIYSMLPPFPDLVNALKKPSAKTPGAAEVVVYLLVTSERWHEITSEIWKMCSAACPPTLTKEDWETIGQWVLGFEEDKRRRFLADIISGPLDADKLDYIARDAYFAGIPVGHDYERYISLACIDYQGEWWRLTLPAKGLNALEQLIMARLALTSYLYHHQKVRAAEAWFERLLAREYREKKTFFGLETVWDLFRVEDSELYDRAKAEPNGPWARLLHRQLPVRYLEFRQRDLAGKDSERAAQNYEKLLIWTNEPNWCDYVKLLDLEGRIANEIGVDPDSVIVDVPRTPGYAELENLELPGRSVDSKLPATDTLSYKDWIDAYKAHRAYVRVFAPRGKDRRTLFEAAKKEFGELGLRLQESNQVPTKS